MEAVSLSRDEINFLREKMLITKEENLNYQRSLNKELKREQNGDMVDLANFDLDEKQETMRRGWYVEMEKKLNLALERIVSGEYGTCEDCDMSIGLHRLKLEPTAIRCVECQESVELKLN